MKQFDWQEMQEFWRVHGSTWSAQHDYEKDPDGLNVVLYSGASRWLNRYFSHFQRKIYRELLGGIPRQRMGESALDIGCGAGRWCCLLRESGYEATGIDLQPELIAQNRKRHPDMQFHCGALQDFEAAQPFDLVSSVTVLQHIPYAQQTVAIRKLRELTKTDGHALMLENILETGPHVFHNSILQWIDLFKNAGFRALQTRRYDYSPCFRLHAWAVGKISHILGLRKAETEDLSPLDFASAAQERKSFLHRASDGARDMAIGLDWPVETLMVRLNVKFSSIHCGFVFKAV